MTTIGFDIGGTAVKGGCLDEQGRVLREGQWPTPMDVDDLVALLVARTREWGAFDAVGVACAGIIDGAAGVVVTSPNLPSWSRVPLAEKVRAELDRPVAVFNDANAFTLAEARRGAGRGCQSLVGISLGTGIGGGLVLDGEIWEGVHGYAGEPGHMVLQLDGPPCACGNRGCFEALIGTAGILRCYQDFGGAERTEDGSEVRPRDIAERAERGEPAAVKTFAETGRILGIGIASINQLLDVERFVIGGGISQAGDLFLLPARDALRATALQPTEEVPEICLAELGNSAGWIGAAEAVGHRPTARG